MDVQIAEEPEIRIVARKVEASLEGLSEEVPKAWAELQEVLPGIGPTVEPLRFYGVFPVREQLEEAPLRRYWVGVGVREGASVPEGYELLTLPPRRYAVAAVKGHREAIARSYRDLFAALERSGHQRQADGYAFELYEPKRQSPFPAENGYERFDYDIYQPLA